jgi:hypothetical protein
VHWHHIASVLIKPWHALSYPQLEGQTYMVATLDLNHLNQRLAELNDPLSNWYSQLDAKSKEIFEAEPITGENFLERVNESLRIAKAHAGEGPWKPLNGLLDELCTAYLQSRAAQSRQIRALVNTYPSIARAVRDDYLARAIEQREVTHDPRWLSIALAAISIENNAVDFRDTYGVLGRLYLTAVGAGTNPKPAFRAVAKISATDTKGSTSLIPMRWFLRTFHLSAYFSADVRPHLQEYRQRQIQKEQPWWAFWRHK